MWIKCGMWFFYFNWYLFSSNLSFIICWSAVNDIYNQLDANYWNIHPKVTRWLYCVERHNSVFDSKRSVIRAQAVYFLLRQYLVSRVCDRVISAFLRVTYFQFPIRSAFHPCRSPGSTAVYWFAQYQTSDVAENLGRYFPCMACIAQGNDCELILTVKMKTRHPVEEAESSGSKFLAICNHCVVMAACSRKTWKFYEQFLRFLLKQPIMAQFSKLCSVGFHRDIDRRSCFQIS